MLLIFFFGSDNETALKNVARHVWPTIPHYLCYWRIQMNILTALNQHSNDKNGNFVPTVEDNKLWNGLIRAFNEMNRANTESKPGQIWN